MGAGRTDGAFAYWSRRSGRPYRRSRTRICGYGRRATRFVGLSGGRSGAATAHDKLQIAQIDEHAEGLPYDEHRVFPVERVTEQHQTAADREHPERGRHDTPAGAFRGYPLHDETHGEQRLCDIADQNSPIHASDEYIVEIAANGLCDIDQHLYCPSILNLRNSLFAADQPPHPGQIQDADPQPVPHPVVRHAVRARTIDHINVANVVTFTSHQRRQEPVKAIEGWQFEKYVAADCLESAARVAGSVAQDGAAHGIGNTRLKLLEPACLATDALSGNEAGSGRTRFKRTDQRRDECRIVLPVAVERHHDRRARSGNAGAHRRRLAAGLLGTDKTQPGMPGHQLRKLRARRVARTVVNINDLERPLAVQGFGDFRHKRSDIAGLVAYRHDNGDRRIDTRHNGMSYGARSSRATVFTRLREGPGYW